ncbi:DUF748 domain-containing protein [Desulfoplanes formicivorans]|nr:DUF748 domain-containing protein [Desulfoplanes formicivorans]
MKTLVILLGLFVVYTALGFMAVPPIAQSVLSARLEQALSRRVVIKKIECNPLTLRAQVQGVVVYGTDNSTVEMSLDRLDVDVQAVSVFRGAIVVKRLVLDTPSVFVHVLDASGRTNLTDLVAGDGNQEPEPEESSEAGSLFPVIIRDFACINGTLRVQDDPRSVNHLIDGIELFVPYFSTHSKDLGTQILPRLAFRLNKTPFEIQGTSTPFASSRRTEFDLSEAGLDLTAFWKYVPIGPQLTLVSGRATTDLSLLIEESDTGDHPLSLFLAGQIELDDAQLSHQRDGTILSCHKLVVPVTRFDWLRREIAFANIRVQDPFVAVIRESADVINWQRYVQEIQGRVPGGNNTTAAAGPDQPSMDISASSILVENGRIHFRDKVVDQGFETDIAPLNVEIRDFDTRAQAVSRVRLDAGTSQGASLALTADVVVTPFACNGTTSLDNATIPAFASYYARYLPLELYRGQGRIASGFVITQDNGLDMQWNNVQVHLADMQLRKPGAPKPCIGFDTLSLEGGSIDLTGRRVGFVHAMLTVPRVVLERDSHGKVDLVTLFAGHARQANGETPPAEDVPAESVPWQIAIGQVHCADGYVEFRDHAVKQRVVNQVGDVDLDLVGVSTDPEQSVGFTLAAVVNQGGTVRAKGTVIPATLGSTGDLDISRLGIAPITPYLPESMHIDVGSGRLDLAGSWDFAGQKSMTGTIRGNIRMADVMFSESGNKSRLAGFDALEVNGIQLGLEPRVLSVDRVVVTSPDMILAKDEQGILNLARVLGGTNRDRDSPSSKTTAQGNTQPYWFRDMDINRVQVSQGRVDFHDHSLSPHFTVNLDKISLDLRHVSLDPAKRAQLDLNATLNDHAPVSLRGDISPLRQPVASNLLVRLSHMDMTSLTPYTLKSLAYPIVQGKLNWNGKFVTEANVLDATNTFFVQQFQLGDKVDSPDAVNVPIKLGLALLQDGNGDLTLDVPVHGRLDDPQFRLGGLIFKAIIGIFSKIATAPFALIGAMFGGGDDLSHLDYGPGQSMLSPASRIKLDTMITALTKRPKLRVFVSGMVDADADRLALEHDAFMRKLKERKHDAGKDKALDVNKVTIAPDEYMTWLFEAYKATPGKKPRRFGRVVRPSQEAMEQAVRQHISIGQDDLLDLANQRARGVQQYLLEKGNIAPDRVFVTSSKFASGDEDQPGMRVDLSLGK